MSGGPEPLPKIAYPAWLQSPADGTEPVRASEPVATARPADAPPVAAATAPTKPDDPVSKTADFFGAWSDVMGWVLDVEKGLPGAARFVELITGFKADTIGDGLNVLGATMAAVSQYRASTATTTVGKAIDAGGAAGVDMFMGGIHPAVPVIDKAIGLAFEHGLGVKGVSATDTLNTSVRSIVTLGDGLVTGDITGMNTFHTSSLNGEYGPVFREASEAGDYWADQGIVGGLEAFGSDLGELTGLW